MNLFNATKKAAAMLGVAVGVIFAQGVDTAYVPFRVNVAANILVEYKSGASVIASAQTSAPAVTDVTLAVPLPEGTVTGVLFGTPRRSSLPVVSGNGGGKVALNLPAQSYKNARIALYGINGKRVLSAKFSASQAVNSVSRRNVVAGVYLLSIKGSDAAASVTSRVTHRGGSLEINAAFGGDNLASVPQMAKKSASGDWTITVSATETGYVDSVYTLGLVSGTNPKQNITLRASGNDGVGTITDARDNKTYLTIKIGNQTWMKENLNHQPATGNSWCYGGDNSNCAKYGRLYDWSTAMDIEEIYNGNVWGGGDTKRQGVCPSEWHLPSRVEWGTLAKAAGGTGDYGAGGTAGTKLKSTSGWSSGNGTDEFGFSALPGGSRYPDGSFGYVGLNGNWWTATEYDGSNAYSRGMYYDYDYVGEYISYKGYGFSVRCLRD